MTDLIPQHFIDELLARVDILDVIESRVKLKKSGKNYSGLCPFHQEKTPSFSVNPDKQFYYCFGCGAGGNSIGFLMDFEKTSFPEAIEILSKLTGMQIPKNVDSSQSKSTQQNHKNQLSILDQATKFYQQQLLDNHKNKKALDYLKKRDLNKETILKFQLGYAPPGWSHLIDYCLSKHISKEHLIEAGLVIHNQDKDSYYDRFRDRIIFPIRNTKGQVIAFGGRVLGDDKPKYLNSPETEIFHKSRELYGLYEAKHNHRKINRLIVVEGYMDVISLAQHGIGTAVATLGTAISEHHLRVLFKHSPEVIFCFDGDQAGKNAANRALHISLEQIEDNQSVRFLFLPDNQDPDSLIKTEGLENFETRIVNASPLSQFFFDRLLPDESSSSLDDRARLASTALPYIHKMKARLLQQMMLEKVSQLTGLSINQLTNLQSLQNLNQPNPHEPQPALSDSAHQLYYEQESSLAATDSIYYEHYPDHNYHEYSPSRKKPPTRIVSLVDRIIAMLLQNPGMASSVPDPESLGNLQETNLDLLIELMCYFSQNPDNSLGTLVIDWQYDQQHKNYLILLNQISKFDFLSSNTDIEREFLDAITRLKSRQPEKQLDRLLQKKKHTPLSAAENATLLTLLMHKHKK